VKGIKGRIIGSKIYQNVYIGHGTSWFQLEYPVTKLNSLTWKTPSLLKELN